MTWWQYLMLVNLYLLLFYGFYVLLLKKETFFQLNRIYLISASLLSFLIPLIQSDWVKNLFITQKVQYTIYNSPVVFYQFKPITNSHITVGEVLVVIYLVGMLLLMVRLIWQLIILNRIINQPQSTAAYSFFKKIKLGEDLIDNKVIIAHENVHARQWHSADILMIETVMIINWFNPIVYLYRNTIKHIHEFIADRQALKTGTDKADYALLLLSQTFDAPVHQLVNPFFNHSLLKQRIVMLQKSKSHKIALVKYGLSAPLFMLMLILSSATINNSKTVNFFNRKAEQVFSANAGYIQSGDNYSTVKVENKTGKAVMLPKSGKISSALTDSLLNVNDKIFTSVEKVPEFKGGLQAFGEFLGSNIKYPANSRNKGTQGRVIITFIVEKNGTLTDAHVVRGVDPEIDQEALRVINLSPNWAPGIQNGKTVRVAYSVPIAFTLQDDSEPVSPTADKSDNLIGFVNNTGTKSLTFTPDAVKADTNKKISDFHANSFSIASPSGGLSSRPLFIVDGKESNIKDINPDDIESITVVKDKAKTAIYGDKAANGVIFITLKKADKPIKIFGN